MHWPQWNERELQQVWGAELRQFLCLFVVEGPSLTMTHQTAAGSEFLLALALSVSPSPRFWRWQPGNQSPTFEIHVGFFENYGTPQNPMHVIWVIYFLCERDHFSMGVFLFQTHATVQLFHQPTGSDSATNATVFHRLLNWSSKRIGFHGNFPVETKSGDMIQLYVLKHQPTEILLTISRFLRGTISIYIHLPNSINSLYGSSLL